MIDRDVAGFIASVISPVAFILLGQYIPSLNNTTYQILSLIIPLALVFFDYIHKNFEYLKTLYGRNIRVDDIENKEEARSEIQKEYSSPQTEEVYEITYLSSSPYFDDATIRTINLMVKNHVKKHFNMKIKTLYIISKSNKQIINDLKTRTLYLMLKILQKILNNQKSINVPNAFSNSLFNIKIYYLTSKNVEDSHTFSIDAVTKNNKPHKIIISGQSKSKVYYGNIEELYNAFKKY